MGVRKSQGKNKKSPRPTAAVTVQREDALRQAARRQPPARSPQRLPGGTGRRNDTPS